MSADIPTEPHPNWSKLLDAGATMESHISQVIIRVGNLDEDTAIKLGHALTVELDRDSPWQMYRNYTLEQAKSEVHENKLHGHGEAIFGPTRPADRNCSVKVEGPDGDGTYELITNICNDFEDKPELEGPLHLQLGFIAAIESVDL